MNTTRKMATFFALALATTVLCVGSALAQGLGTVNAQGKFTLPFQARWGLATLPAGQYTFSVGYTQGGTTMIEVKGEGEGLPHALIMAQGQTQTPTTRSSELVCVRHSQNGTVRAIVISDLGQTFYFSMPKGERLLARKGSAKAETQVAEAPELIQRIRVDTMGR